MAHDVIIRNGTLIDGTGAAGKRADLAIDGDRITAIGAIEGGAALEIDAAGKLVTPGFVDIHTHLDAQLAWDPNASSSCYHGITSVVLGNCGVTFAPCKPQDRDYLAKMMESVEDIPAASILSGFAVGLGNIRRIPRVAVAHENRRERGRHGRPLRGALSRHGRARAG